MKCYLCDKDSPWHDKTCPNIQRIEPPVVSTDKAIVDGPPLAGATGGNSSVMLSGPQRVVSDQAAAAAAAADLDILEFGRSLRNGNPTDAGWRDAITTALGLRAYDDKTDYEAIQWRRTVIREIWRRRPERTE